MSNYAMNEVGSDVQPVCPKCDTCTDPVSLWDANIESFDGDQITMRAEHACDECDISFDVIWYSTIHSVEVEA